MEALDGTMEESYEAFAAEPHDRGSVAADGDDGHGLGRHDRCDRRAAAAEEDPDDGTGAEPHCDATTTMTRGCWARRSRSRHRISKA